MKTMITCEHASAEIPAKYQKLFSSHSAQKALNTHRGYDIGAKEVAKALSNKADFFILGVASRLLIDLNRSIYSKNLFSEWSSLLSKQEKEELIQHYYLAYRETVEEQVVNWLGQGEAVRHISIHSFTPELNGEIRQAEIGLLYDPARKKEQALARGWQEKLKKILPTWRIRCNYPYHGRADGLTTYLRKKFSENYYGIEIEINQQLFLNISSQEIASYLRNIL